MLVIQYWEFALLANCNANVEVSKEIFLTNVFYVKVIFSDQEEEKDRKHLKDFSTFAIFIHISWRALQPNVTCN